MTRLTYSQEENHQATLAAEATTSSEAEQILHFKRLIVTMKQYYEKSLQQLQTQFQSEQNQRLTAQNDLKKVQTELSENQKLHEEERDALIAQHLSLKELLKKTQNELALPQNFAAARSEQKQEKRVEQLEQIIPFLRDQTAEANLEMEKLKDELNESQKKVKGLEQELLESKQSSQRKIEQFQHMLKDQKLDVNELETVVSTTSSHYLRLELEDIKRTIIQGSEETRTLETRYVEMLNEKISLEHQYKQLQTQFERQSSNLTAFQEQIHDLENRKNELEKALLVKEKEWIESCKQGQELRKEIENLNEWIKEKALIQDKYEQLKDEWKQLSDCLEEAVENQSQTEYHLNNLETLATHQETQIQEFVIHIETLSQEKETFESDRNQLKILLDESEARLKMAQQHLAKKVKEVAFLEEKLEEEHSNLTNFAQTIEYQKTQLAQLQASVDLYQRQEKRLQEQLHEALKGTENQIIKWEEKYFRMYDKWQESENRVRELKKFEEKHAQMQSLLANLGNFMGGAFKPGQSLFNSGQEMMTDRPPVRPYLFDAPSEENPSETPKQEFIEEKFDLFGMRQPPEKYNPNLFT